MTLIFKFNFCFGKSCIHIQINCLIGNVVKKKHNPYFERILSLMYRNTLINDLCILI